MCDEEDEDVIFEGSAIHQHLLSTGYSDYEITQTSPNQQTKNWCSEESKEKVAWSPLLKKKLFDFISNLLWPKKLRKSFYLRISRIIYESKLQNSDDLLLLKHFAPHTFVSSDQKNDSSITLELFLWCMRGVLLILIVFLCLLFSVEDSSLWSSTVFPPAYISIACIVTAGAVGYYITRLLITFISYSLKLYRSIKEVEHFVKALQEAAHLISKSLRLLLEEDLVSRGFVLAQGSNSFPSSNSREAPHCEGLRRTLHNTLYALLPILNNAHVSLKMLVCHYPCIRELFDDFEEIDSQQQQNSIEHLKFLKKLVTLVKLQISAVMTELVLCVADIDVFEKVLDNQGIFSGHKFFEIGKQVDILSKHFMYAQEFWQKDLEKETLEYSCEEKKKDVYLAIHSLALHMQAALFRVQELEKKFECLEDTGGNILDVLPSYEGVKEQLNSVQLELQSCQGCLEETVTRVDMKYMVKEKEETECQSDGLVNVSEDVTSTIANKKPPIPLFELEEPIIKDEVFEAYIDQEYYDNRSKEIDDDFWNTDAKQERQKLKKQKEQGKRVLHELQPLLTKLRKDWEEREAAALQRQKTEVVNASSTVYGKMIIPQNAEYSEMSALTPAVIRMNSENRKRDVDSSILKDFQKTEKEIDVTENKCENLQLGSMEALEDSDDERLEAYRRVKKELDMDEASLTTIDSVEDSDDERLEVYKRIKMELDKEENSEIFNSRSLESNVKQDNVNFCPPRSMGLVKLQCDVKDKIDYHVTSDVQKSKGDGKMLTDAVSKISKSMYEINESLSASTPVESETISENDSPVSCLKYNDSEASSSKEMQEEIFVHGEEIEDDSHCIDWNTITLPVRITDTLEDRMELFCEGQNRGFHAEIAAKAQAASHQFLTSRRSATETFHGIGESEEVFGDDSSEDDSG